MQILIIVLIAAAGVAAVLVPVLRGGAHYDVSGDLDRPEAPDAEAAEPRPATPEAPAAEHPAAAEAAPASPAAAPSRNPAAAEPAPSTTPPGAEAGARTGAAGPIEDEPAASDLDFGLPAGLDGLIARYRAAVRADTVCPRCRQANPPGSRYCFECGQGLGPGGE